MEEAKVDMQWNLETISTEILASSAIKESEQKGRRVGKAEGGKVG